MWNVFRKLGLKWILYISFPLVLCVMLLVLASVVSENVSSSLTEGLEARGNALLQNMAGRATLPFLQNKADMARGSIDESFGDPDLGFLVLAAVDGTILAQRFRDPKRGFELPALLQAYRDHPGQELFAVEDFDCLKAPVYAEDIVENPESKTADEALLLGGDSAPAPGHGTGRGKIRGWVYLGMSTAGIHGQTLALRRKMVEFMLGGVLVFIVMVYFISRQFVLRPLETMIGVASRVSECDLTERVEKTADDELGGMADALNRITSNLNQTLAKVKGVTEGVSQVIERITRTSDVVAHGAQTTAASVDETSTSMEEMIASLKGIAENVEVLAQSAEESSSSILQMAATNDEVVENIQSLAASVEETTSAIEQMTFSIKEVAKNVEDLSATAEETSSSMNEMDVSIGQVESNANETARLSEQVSTDAETGVVSLQKTLTGIDKIKDSSKTAAEVIESLGKKIGTIGNILNVIDDVAEQTNLLALNAAIIAAQAGEHGKGFAVVADEIKDLAERTGLSTKEIAELVQSIQDESHNAIAAMERGVKNVEEGVRLGGEAEDALKKIFDSAKKSTQMVKAIARATVEQAKGSKQVTNAITRIAETVQQIAKATAEQARGSEQIMKSSEKMKVVTKHVERSSQEQARGSKQITRAIENISEMVNHLNRAQKEQTKGSEQVMHAVENIKGVAEAQNRSMTDLEAAIDLLRQQAEVLRDEVRRFKV
ncbi:MAG: methyl-accepting chemotaxis protein [Myxococcales bacterium]